MNPGTNLAEIAALVGDPARANILSALMAGRALTAGELAFHAGVTPQTTSGHLGQLLAAGLLAVSRQGRHRYYRLASPLVGRMLESIMAIATAPRPVWRGDQALRDARTCYDHLAGRLAVKLTDALIAQGHVVLSDDGGEVTASGHACFETFGMAIGEGRRVFCKPCLDWSERRPHLAGRVGAAIATRAFDLAWVERIRDTRAIRVTAAGRQGLRAMFGIDAADPG